MATDWVAPVANVMLQGLWLTVTLGMISVVLSVSLGVVLGVAMALPKNPWTTVLKIILQGYLQLLRGLPLIVTLFIVFFVSPIIGIHLDSFMAAVVGLSLWGSANVMAVAQGAIASIPRGQRESAAALGFGWLSSMAWIIFPQAIRRMTPSTVNLVVDLIQATTLASLIGVLEVLARSRQAVEYNQLATGDGHAVPIFGALLVVFFLICFPLTRIAARLERQRTRRRRQADLTETAALAIVAHQPPASIRPLDAGDLDAPTKNHPKGHTP